MKPGDAALTNKLKSQLIAYSKQMPLPGIASNAEIDCFVAQMVDSIRRVRYAVTISNKPITPGIANPLNASFNPIKAAVWQKNQGNINEAFWLVFLSTHFGRNKTTGWELVRNIYGGLGGQTWDWLNISQNIAGFQHWLSQNNANITGHFGNHRKYESIRALGNKGTGVAFASYVNWVGPNHDHQDIINNTLSNTNGDPYEMFGYLYKNMKVVRFGRTAKFDYLCMIGKLGLIDIYPNSTYMTGATGPYDGASLLFGNGYNRKTLDSLLSSLETYLGIPFGMQILEDALCNWQKSPGLYRYFGG